MKTTAEKLAEAHWEYIEALLRNEINASNEPSECLERYIQSIGFHYKTAMIHGYKHGVIDGFESAKESG